EDLWRFGAPLPTSARNPFTSCWSVVLPSAGPAGSFFPLLPRASNSFFEHRWHDFNGRLTKIPHSPQKIWPATLPRSWEKRLYSRTRTRGESPTQERSVWRADSGGERDLCGGGREIGQRFPSVGQQEDSRPEEGGKRAQQ
ncbi:unnamed protein product, partial [Ectocarpus fasciculatus]